MSLACYCNSHHHFRADHPVAGCLVSGCDCQAMSGGPAERARLPDAALSAISVEHERDHSDSTALPRAGCNGCRMIAYAWSLRERLEAEAAQTRALREALEATYDALVPLQHSIGVLPQGGYSSVMTPQEKQLADIVAALGAARAALTGAPRENLR